MNAALRHRGPDDQGIVEIPLINTDKQCSLFLGNTRLAILDTSLAGHQPMHDVQTGNWLTYNGETYNFRALHQQISDGYGPWKSNTDTEVVLRAYSQWGIEAFNKLRGMFALAIWDARAQQLILARDSFGIKPLYFSIIDKPESNTKHFIFASELRALLASKLVPGKLSGPGVRSFLSSGSIQSPLTILDGVTSLEPGQQLIVQIEPSGELVVTRSKLSRKASANPVNTRAHAVVRLREELENSVRSHLVSDVPLGVFLSGGMDSSALVALMKYVGSERPRTFTVVFEERQFSETHHASVIASQFGTEHCEIPVTEDHLLTSLPEAVASLDQPTIDGINTYTISRAVKNAGVTVALSGIGGDELFAGYPSFARALKLRSLAGFSRRLLQATASVGRLALNDSVRGRKFSQLVQSSLTPLDVYRISRQLFSEQEIAELMLTDAANPHNSSFADETSDTGPEADWINSISRLELFGYMSNTLLRDTDSTSMANSLEVRVPFVDVNVVDYVLQVPGDWKLDGSRPNLPKALLADAISDLLPVSFLSRPKMGFTLPFEKWMNGRLRNPITEVLEDKTHVEQVGLKHQQVKSVLRRFFLSPKAIGWTRPWSLYVLTRWCELNGVSA
jgi:asparagine synthase (glutamine-hydrolysing)